MKDRSTATEALCLPESYEAGGRTPAIGKERVPARRASFTYPSRRRARHLSPERPLAHARANHSRFLWFTGLYVASIALFGAFVSAERALLALI
jgi:hypothetical protein